jgi:hypothetical protein
LDDLDFQFPDAREEFVRHFEQRLPSDLSELYDVSAAVWLRIGKKQTQLIPHVEKMFGLGKGTPNMCDAEACFEGIDGHRPHLVSFAEVERAWPCLHLLADRDERPVVLVSSDSPANQRGTHPLLADSLVDWFVRLQSFGFDMEAACADALERIESPHEGDYDRSVEVRWNQERLPAEQTADSIAAIDRALEKLESMTSDDGQVLDPQVAAYMQEEVIHSRETPYVVTGRPNGAKSVAAYMERRFGVAMPEDLDYFLTHVGGVAVHTEPEPLDWPEAHWLRGEELVDEAENLRENVTHDDGELPTIPLAIAYPGGPNVSIWVDKHGPPYRVVTYDHETSSDVWFQVVAESVGEAFEAYVDERLSVLDVTNRRSGWIRAGS